MTGSPERKLRIAFLGGRGIPSTYSGYETFFLEVAPRLAERGHDVTVYCRKSLFAERPSSYRGVHLIYTPSIETKNLGTWTHTLSSLLDVIRRDFDAVLVVNVANALHCVLPCIFGKQCALNVDGIEWKRGKWGRLGKAYFYLNGWVCGKILPRGIITDAYAMRQLYLQEFKTPSACIAYGGSIGVSTNPEVLREYGLEPRKYYLVLGRLVPENSVDVILEGFKKSGTTRILAVVGDANYQSQFVSNVQKIAGAQVRFLGHVSNQDHIRELYCNSYAYIHGHTVGGTNPALLHALGYGSCILANGNPFNEEVLGGYGLLFQDADDLCSKIHTLEEDPKLAADYRLRSPERIKVAYTWEHITDQYEEFFYQLATGENATQVHSSVCPRKEAAE